MMLDMSGISRQAFHVS